MDYLSAFLGGTLITDLINIIISKLNYLKSTTNLSIADKLVIKWDISCAFVSCTDQLVFSSEFIPEEFCHRVYYLIKLYLLKKQLEELTVFAAYIKYLDLSFINSYDCSKELSLYLVALTGTDPTTVFLKSNKHRIQEIFNTWCASLGFLIYINYKDKFDTQDSLSTSETSDIVVDQDYLTSNTEITRYPVLNLIDLACWTQTKILISHQCSFYGPFYIRREIKILKTLLNRQALKEIDINLNTLLKTISNQSLDLTIEVTDNYKLTIYKMAKQLKKLRQNI